MPCGKRPLIKTWDRPRNIRIITPSRYEQNEASVKVHWKNVLRTLELSYKDEQFWESQSDTVREIVGPIIFKRIAKIFNLKPDDKQYEPQSEASSVTPSDQFYQLRSVTIPQSRPVFSITDFDMTEEESVEDEEDSYSETSESLSELKKTSRSKSVVKSKSFMASKSFSKSMTKSFSRMMSKTMSRSFSTKSKGYISEISTLAETASTLDDLIVHAASKIEPRRHYRRIIRNPHYDMLYCNKSETDMIKWKSKYKQKTFEVSASDEFSKKAEIMAKKIAKEFYDWWVGLGNVEFKSEIKRPEDVESLFQVWFDEHASRGLVLDPRILPCVLQSIATYVGVPKASCPKALKRQIASDIHAETSPAHLMAFGTCLPEKMKHIPPKNNTKKIWRCVKIPEDLRSMACVWDEVQHLTSTKSFRQWLQKRPHLLMPPFFKALEQPGDKKQLFVVPSDYVVKDRSASSSTQDLALPVSQFSIELKEVLSKLMNE
ncbi:uncharacterized protein [Epargyreus clarus]|uniref:uncharacterized protein n=1 Tax=Epargyreus clarus TaxID=520877 RepID=UPI003C3096A7